jgi:flagella basal body P-ring formation protein FlgA
VPRLAGPALSAAVLWLIAVGLCLLAGRAASETGTGRVLHTQADLDQAIGQALAQAFPQRPPEWEVTRRHPFEQLEAYAFELVVPETPAGGRTWFQLRGQRRTGAPDVKTFLVPVDVFWSDSAWVAARSLPTAHVLAAGDLERRWVRHTTGPDEVAAAAAPVGLALTRALAAGELVQRTRLRDAPVIARGDIVRLVYRRGGLLVSARAEALQGGAPGEEINVRPLDGRRTCRGRVQSPDEVEVIAP